MISEAREGNTRNQYGRLITVQPVERRDVRAFGNFRWFAIAALRLISSEKVGFAQRLEERTEGWGRGSLDRASVAGRSAAIWVETTPAPAFGR